MMLVPLLAVAVFGAGEPRRVQPPGRCSCISQVVRDRLSDSERRRLLLDYSEAWFVGTVVRAVPAFRPLGEPNFRRQH